MSKAFIIAKCIISTIITNFYFLRTCNMAMGKNRHCQLQKLFLFWWGTIYKLSGFDQIGDLGSVDSLCRGSTEAQYMQCLSIALLYLPCCEKDLLRQERRHSLHLFGWGIVYVSNYPVFCKIKMCWAVTFDFCFVVEDERL